MHYDIISIHIIYRYALVCMHLIGLTGCVMILNYSHKLKLNIHALKLINNFSSECRKNT